MEVFGMMGYMIGTMGFIFGVIALSKVSALEKELNEAGLLGKKSDPGWKKRSKAENGKV